MGDVKCFNPHELICYNLFPNWLCESKDFTLQEKFVYSKLFKEAQGFTMGKSKNAQFCITAQELGDKIGVNEKKAMRILLSLRKKGLIDIVKDKKHDKSEKQNMLIKFCWTETMENAAYFVKNFEDDECLDDDGTDDEMQDDVVICEDFGKRAVRDASQKTERSKIGDKLRFRVMRRDGFHCQLCGATGKTSQLVIDHIYPISKGGTSEFENLQTLCFECNSGKSDDSVIDSAKKEKKWWEL